MIIKTTEKAITIVALVITVIIILILAGVTVNLTIGNNGVLISAQTSSNIYANRSKDETEMLKSADLAIKEETSDDRTLVGLFNSGVLKVGDYISYELPEQGSFTTSTYGDNTSNGFAEQTFNINNNGIEINWRILGLGDDNGKLTLDKNLGKCLLMISDNPVQKNINLNSNNDYDKNPYLYMGKAEGYENSERILNGIAGIYKNNRYATLARSINADDINTILGIEVEDGIVYEKEDNDKNNIDLLRAYGSSYNYTEGNYSANSYLKGKTALENDEIYVLGTAYSYLIANYKSRTIGNTTIEDLLFSGISFESLNAKSYWINNRGIEINRKVGFGIGEVCYDSVNIGCSKFYSNGTWQVEGRAVYPIIALKPELTNQDINVIYKNKSKWDYVSNISFYGNLDNY